MQICRIIILLLMTSCSSYVSKLHSKMSNDMIRQGGSRAPQSVEVLSEQSGRNTNRRYTSSDFEDNEPTPSLWAGSGNDSFFDTTGVKKEKGDIITILVMNDLKNKIQFELQRLFSKTKDQPQAAEKNTSEDKKVFDKISSIVRKEIRSNHIMLIGRKELIFENVKRLIEVSALVNRKDISAEDTVISTKILQTNIKVLR